MSSMAQAWGLAQERSVAEAAPVHQTEAADAGPARDRRRLSPEAAHSAHKGIFWLHFSAVLVWLLVSAVFGALIAAGKDVPMIVLLASLAALLGHGLFLATHFVLASHARKRAAGSSVSG
jgi:hypothetical protein